MISLYAHLLATATPDTEQGAAPSHEETEGKDETYNEAPVQMYAPEHRPEEHLESVHKSETDVTSEQSVRAEAGVAYDEEEQPPELREDVVTSELDMHPETGGEVRMQSDTGGGDGKTHKRVSKSVFRRMKEDADDKLERDADERVGKRHRGSGRAKARTGDEKRDKNAQTEDTRLSELPIRPGALLEKDDVKMTPPQRYDFQQYEIDLQLYREMRKKARNYARGTDVLEAKAMTPRKVTRFRSMWEHVMMFFEKHFPPHNSQK
ncbi:UNVERIFIED_CONTAM: hypothetical protein HHA_450900 [Hammondia hammondi]|eukprot:XP_008883373.1 hypothetical protein HHA_450900 [Hammondia hammondi]